MSTAMPVGRRRAARYQIAPRSGWPTTSLLPGLDPNRLAPLLVVGDLICDHYIWGDVERVSPEAPVQVLGWQREADRPGGAANVAMNLAALGCRVYLAGVVGRDAAGRRLVGALRAGGVDARGVIEVADRPTTVKTRIIARGQHLLRIDRETRRAVDAEDERSLIATINRLSGEVSGLICSDYGKGVLSGPVLDAIFSRAVLEMGCSASRCPVVLVDPKGRDFSKYLGADILTPNERELIEATTGDDRRADGGDSLEHRARSLVRQLGLRALLVTRGASGMDLFEADSQTHIPVLQRHEVFDVTGAGDTVAAVMGLAASAGVPLLEAARLANAAAGIVVGTVGTSAVEPEALARVLDGAASQARAKILSTSTLKARVEEARARGETIVFTNGCFDLLHVGHLHLLQRARAQGDRLVVAINTDASVRRVKGSGRPLIPESQRAEVVAALRCVDYVTLFPEPTPLRLMRILKPDVLVKGSDYTKDQVVGREVVERYGGRVELVPLIQGFSTLTLLESIQRRKVS